MLQEHLRRLEVLEQLLDEPDIQMLVEKDSLSSHKA
jgi:hypothetical protein